MSALSFITADPDQGIDTQPVPARLPLLARRVPMGRLLGLLVGWLALDMLLLWQFLGLTSPALTVAGVALSALLVRFAAKSAIGRQGPTVATLLACVAIAALVLAVGGEGRFFYANPDWRVRDALLRDMVLHRWPYAYATPDGIELLRAPVAMYLLPALGGKLGGQAGADLTLLAQNAILDGALFALASILFATRRAKLIALGCFLAFSGFDILGELMRGHAAMLTPTAHLEGWSVTQYSSTITLFFWVPQHAFAGWCGALALLLWRDGRVRVGVPLMIVPLVTLWSPLAAMGLMPFMAWGGGSTRWSVAGCPSPISFFRLARCSSRSRRCSISRAVASRSGSGYFSMIPLHYLLFEGLEVVPFLLVAAAGARGRFGGMLFAITAFSLLLMPFGRIGWSIDFAMRASIPALAILSVQLSEVLASAETSAMRKRIGIACLLIGSVTGLHRNHPRPPLPDIAGAALPADQPVARLSRFHDRIFILCREAEHAAPVDPPADPSVIPLAPACRDAHWPLPALFH